MKAAVVVVFSYGLVVSFMYFNCEVRDNSGVSTKCRDALQNFLNSPAWVDMKTQLLRIYEVIKLHGWSRLYEEIINSIDPLGEKKALEVSLFRLGRGYRKLLLLNNGGFFCYFLNPRYWS